MRKTLLFICIIFSFRAMSQDVGIVGGGISAGAMNYKGDLDDNNMFRFTKSGFGIHFILLPYTKFNFSLNFLHGRITADDAKAVSTGNRYRNLNFYSDINEFSLMTLYKFQDRNTNFLARQKWVPYLFVGIAFFHFNPMTKLHGVVYELQKIGTEGQNLGSSPGGDVTYPKPYKLWQFSIPFGVGVKFKITKDVDAGFEIGPRKTFTDYLDDISGNYPDKDQLHDKSGEVALYLSDPSNDPKRPTGKKSFSHRGDSSKKDWYLYSNLNITYYFTTKIYKAKQKYRF